MSASLLRLMVLIGAFGLLSGCHVGRFVYWNFADIQDYKKFPVHPVVRGDTASSPAWHFQNLNQAISGKPLTPLTLLPGFDLPLAELNDKNKSVAFLVIRRDTILFEQYYDGYADSSIVPSFSVAKSVTSLLVGCAVADGYIKSVQQPVTDFIPELRDPRFKNITLEHLLNMRSGIKYVESYVNPFGNVAIGYYGTNLMRHVRKLQVAGPPDQGFNYISINPQLLGIVLERATGRPPAQYLSEKLWLPMGMEWDASWSLDSKKNQTTKTFCCLNTRARDYAKLGRLVLNNGNWDGQQLVPADWVAKCQTSPLPDQPHYSYQFWHSVLVGAEPTATYRPNNNAIGAPLGDCVMIGILGQYVYINPAKQVVIVRLGAGRGDVNWIELFRQVAAKL